MSYQYRQRKVSRFVAEEARKRQGEGKQSNNTAERVKLVNCGGKRSRSQ